ncbi:hypothetical protein HY493_02770 [Candidatus Woesearchaeota archaeon]|nr:hypothetical protein [Candidatus Woesearchaeota archaeon]
MVNEERNDGYSIEKRAAKPQPPVSAPPYTPSRYVRPQVKRQCKVLLVGVNGEVSKPAQAFFASKDIEATFEELPCLTGRTRDDHVTVIITDSTLADARQLLKTRAYDLVVVRETTDGSCYTVGYVAKLLNQRAILYGAGNNHASAQMDFDNNTAKDTASLEMRLREIEPWLTRKD